MKYDWKAQRAKRREASQPQTVAAVARFTASGGVDFLFLPLGSPWTLDTFVDTGVLIANGTFAVLCIGGGDGKQGAPCQSTIRLPLGTWTMAELGTHLQPTGWNLGRSSVAGHLTYTLLCPACARRVAGASVAVVEKP